MPGEWMQDVWHEDHKDAPSDGSVWSTEGDQARRMVRGGSWYTRPQGLRSAYRNGSASDFRGSSIGFLVARTL
jgi:formylglycine-generating enzyme required for sulfatase activity